MYLKLFLTFLCLTGSLSSTAQKSTCGLPALLRKIPALDSLRTLPQPLNAQLKTSAIDYGQQHPIPVVFHVVLSQQQINQLGGREGINQRIASQMEIINEDFNRSNSDSNRIPAAFKPLYGNIGVRFALAHVKPTGQPFNDTFELYVTNKNGFELYNNYKSGIGFTEAKYTAAGGLDAWDPAAYLNVWIINPLDTGKASRLAGLTIPPSFTGARYGISPWEQGIVLHYGAFGRRQRATEYYVSTANRGRTLTHELGHFFDLWHIWGDDDGTCPGEPDGNDDGIADTPPQAKEIFGSPQYPLYDACTRTGPGIMFMNFMDYTDDVSKYLFTNEQAARAKRQIQPGAPLYSLTRQPHLLQSDTNASRAINIYPNPASNFINIFFERNPTQLKKITVSNLLGQEVYAIETNEQPVSYYKIDVSGLSNGIYVAKFHYLKGKEARRIVVAR